MYSHFMRLNGRRHGQQVKGELLSCLRNSDNALISIALKTVSHSTEAGLQTQAERDSALSVGCMPK